MGNLFDLNASRLGFFNVLLREAKDKWQEQSLVKHSSSECKHEARSVKSRDEKQTQNL